ncbi:3'(2'),5'-bisphosphate nucleotidase CysQ [Novosphingobium aquiterrae]|uniref:3'(2'),5'-bisphosphate nucleotidase CysQ n=1 Tax=Novosphingobium aquiterrae TaxID=624388 RepID=A0ABV6PFG2_9SPHN
MTDAALAAELAAGAGRILLALRAGRRLEGKALGAEADRQANAFLCEALRRERPLDALLSEEEKDSAARLSAGRCWIVDPLDGTREYGEGRDDWAVHVGLAVNGAASDGAVALPALGLVLRSDSPASMSMPHRRPQMLVSRSRPAPEAEAVARIIGGELVGMGSAGAKAMAVVRGEAEIYLHTGGQYEWDNCAPVAVAQAAGLHVSRADGSPMRYNNPDPYLPDLLICRQEWARPVLAAFASL